MSFTYFSIQSGLPAPLLKTYLDSILHEIFEQNMVGTTVLFSKPTSRRNMLGVENGTLAAHIRQHLQRLGVGFEETVTPPSDVTFKELTIGAADIVEILPGVYIALP